MSYAVQQIHDLCLVVFAEAGPMLKDENDVSLFIAPAFEHEAGMIALPVNRLDATFFQLRSGIAGAVLQKSPARGAARRYPPLAGEKQRAARFRARSQPRRTGLVPSFSRRTRTAP